MRIGPDLLSAGGLRLEDADGVVTVTRLRLKEAALELVPDLTGTKPLFEIVG
jgi:hypothetical protein